MKRTLMIGLLVILTISVGMLISCSGEVKQNPSVDESAYIMVSESEEVGWFETLTTGTSLTKGKVTSIIFTSDTSVCKGLTGTDLTANKTGKVMGYVSGTDIYIVGEKIIANEDCHGMFCNFVSLTDIMFGNLDASKVKDAGDMFSESTSLKSLDLSAFDKANLEKVSHMFQNCKILTTLTNLNFDTQKVTSMGRMFYCCQALTSLNISSFDTSNVTSMEKMFQGCTSLTDLTFGDKFVTSNVNNMNSMFYGCASLKAIYATSGTDWNNETSATSANMFQYCNNLEGGSGTQFRIKQIADKTYARIDGGTSKPGYFTMKPSV